MQRAWVQALEVLTIVYLFYIRIIFANQVYWLVSKIKAVLYHFGWLTSDHIYVLHRAGSAGLVPRWGGISQGKCEFLQTNKCKCWECSMPLMTAWWKMLYHAAVSGIWEQCSIGSRHLLSICTAAEKCHSCCLKLMFNAECQWSLLGELTSAVKGNWSPALTWF